jgi:hypothetical protein
MKKNFNLFNLANIMVLLMMVPSGFSHRYETVETNYTSPSRLSQEYVDLLPAGYIIPDELPATINDPILLIGWVYLYNQQEPISIWNNATLRGSDIAADVIDLNVTIQWNTNNECGGASCTERPICKFNSSCQAALDNPNHVDIIIATHYQDLTTLDIRQLAGTIAHEMIHYLMPFGGADDTLYEEFWAFTVGSTISHNVKMHFEGYNPLKEGCLKLWFHSNTGNYYNAFPSYPPSIEPRANTQEKSCERKQKLPGETDGFPSGI